MSSRTPQALERETDQLVGWLGAAFVATGVTMLAGMTVLFAWAMSLVLTLCLALGARRNGTLGPFKPWLIAALLVWLVAFALMHAASNSVVQLWLGFTEATAVSVYLLWPAPFLLVTLPYAFLFDKNVLSEEDWQAVEQFGNAGERS